MGACARGQLYKECANEPDSHNGCPLTGVDVRSVKYVECAAERLSRKNLGPSRQRYKLRGFRHIVFSKTVLGKKRHSLTGLDGTHADANVVYDAPPLMSGRTRLERIFGPRLAAPDRKIRAAKPAALQAYPDFRHPWLRHGH
jgi:hypothetical protein